MGFPGKYFLRVIILFILLIIAVIMVKLFARPEIISRTDYFMDTTVTIKVVKQPGAGDIIEEALSYMKEKADRFDRFNPESDISVINRNSGQAVKVNEDTVELLRYSLKYARMSQGAFDPTVAPLMDLWGFSKNRKNRVPSPGEIKGVLSRVGYDRIEIYRSNQVYLPPGMAIDLGGLAKGYVVDEGIKFLRDNGIKAGMINAGGNIRVTGVKSPGIPWKFGIRDPEDRGQILKGYIINLKRGSLATSGDYERFFVANGHRYSHLLDPRTGYPGSDLQSVTIYAPTALEADILSTAVFIMGWERGRELIEKIPDVEGLMIKNDQIWLSKGFRELINR
ncbi:FAD:protein FMN transferase [Halothermothrix orenii]|uniref:FAD:protein FMN transferase n=1 Tax=Halothermothrix orenii (strain H 168 / OCM 544 / DSM 9562) TaxID=373903 RepID=B8CY08_HALOH|nr:FAD:protein FMN transferase [Halothermothrix orenii]ACL70177.1 ApbE family lipoprotein [Halothermothrix orenii H 168]